MRFRIGAAFVAGMVFAGVAAAQSQYPPPQPLPDAQGPPEASQPANPQQLDDLVAPIALDPDPLLGEVLAASTYPMEIAEAEQWVRDHPKWKPSKLLNEAKKQNWDPSVQGLVAFPQVLEELSQNIGWTTQLGNAFLAQQAEVMQAVQRMRAQAEARGTLQSTPQETVTTQNQNGQPEITIEPANPDVWYVPSYNPAYVWGPPAFGYYPPLYYPAGAGLFWGSGIDLGLYFGGWGGWGWGGWGWTPDWYGGNIFMNGSFFHRYGFRDFHGEGGFGRSEWMHNPEHRLGVPYGNRAVAGRFGQAGFGGRQGFGGGQGISGRQDFGAQNSAGRGGFAQGNRGGGVGGSGRFGSPAFEQRGWTGNHSAFGGYHNGAATRMQSDHGFSSMGPARTSGGFRGGFGGGGMRGGGGGFRGGGGGGMRGGGGGRR